MIRLKIVDNEFNLYRSSNDLWIYVRFNDKIFISECYNMTLVGSCDFRTANGLWRSLMPVSQCPTFILNVFFT